MNYSTGTVKQANKYSAILKTQLMKNLNILRSITKTSVNLLNFILINFINISKSLNWKIFCDIEKAVGKHIQQVK